uniref:ATP synthase F0 subunit 8 n=1 Tax=Sophrops subrugatus TaxID=2962662 RepID=UPI002114C557|nr:ATP synthase F0 subunit 8 [Sophrops subrugatus]YP_010936641.1 ATP synthase F0 subunit 8 [Sophrops peronosporus]UTE83867.1 ATP synthase F0 subunit 8 [Sophrops subrugatus]WKW91610.1 ATP synthase F0 subunit 8 [Sophrops peronosporus]
MPQMAPLNWLALFISFCLIFLLFNSMNYFCFNYPIKTEQVKKTKTLINWKW